MENQNLYQLFMIELADIFGAENQNVEAMRGLIKHCSDANLKEVVTKHLKETENQVRRIEKIFTILNVTATRRVSKPMAALLRHAEEMTEGVVKSAALDAAIICSLQKVEHYEIAAYGTLKSFAKYLDLDSRIVDLLDESLDEEWSADKKLTRAAKGFLHAVNKEAAEELLAGSRR